jgi:hypothetical protein
VIAIAKTVMPIAKRNTLPGVEAMNTRIDLFRGVSFIIEL